MKTVKRKLKPFKQVLRENDYRMELGVYSLNDGSYIFEEMIPYFGKEWYTDNNTVDGWTFKKDWFES